MTSTPGTFSETNTSLSYDYPRGCGCPACQNNPNALHGDSGPLMDLVVLPGGGGTVTPPSVGINNAEQLLTGYEWGPGGGTAASVTYSFLTSVPSYYASNAQERTNFQPFTAAMKDAVRDIVDMIETFANVTFTEVSGVGEITYGQAWLTTFQSDPGAWAYYPDQGDFSGDVWTNDAHPSSTQNVAVGTYGFYALMHETGHALGLQHSFSAGLTGPENTEQFTVMAYDWSPWGNSQFAESYMLYDIAALQSIYGANMTYHTGNDTYTFVDKSPMTIWDAGGIDTFDTSAVSSSVTLHLEEGGFSSIAETNNVAIAYGAVIENAVTGAGNDFIYGNAADNSFQGNGGNDTIDGAGGQDEALYVNIFSDYLVTVLASSITVQALIGTEGLDTLISIEKIIFADGYFSDGIFHSLLNHDPVAHDDSFTGNQDAAITGNVLADNGFGADSDPDGDPLSVTAGTFATAHGSVSLLTDGSFTYTPNAGYAGADSFAYTLIDGHSGTDTGTVNLTLLPTGPGGAPTIDFTGASFVSYNGLQDNGGTVTVIESGDGIEMNGNTWKKLAFDYTVTENTILTFQYKSTIQGEIGAIGLETDNNYATGPENFQIYGTESPGHFNRDFHYTGAGDWQTITIDIGHYQTGDIDWLVFVNDHDNGAKNADNSFRNVSLYESDAGYNQSPVAHDDSFTGNQDAAITGNVLADNGFGADSDPDGDPLSVTAGTFATAHGSVSLLTDGSFTYTPNAGYAGADSFAYTLIDGHSGTDTGTVNLTLLPTGPGGAPTIDFTGASFVSYNGLQDNGGTVTVIESGDGIEMNGNTWKKLAFDYTVTENTILTFQYKSTIQGEIGAIGLETDNNYATGPENFQIYGTESPGHFNRDFHYTGAGDWQTITIDIGHYQTGDIDWIVFINDHDNGAKNADNSFRNVALFESSSIEGDTLYSGHEAIQPQDNSSLEPAAQSNTISPAADDGTLHYSDILSGVNDALHDVLGNIQSDLSSVAVHTADLLESAAGVIYSGYDDLQLHQSDTNTI